MLEDLATQVIEARQSKAISLEELAASAEISLSELSSIEEGNADQLLEWSLLKVQKLADALEIPIAQLLGEPILNYDEWALVWSALIEYSANRPGLNMKADMKDLIMKVRSYIPNHQASEFDD